MVGKIEGRGEADNRGTRQLDGIAGSMGCEFEPALGMAKDRKPGVLYPDHGVTRSWT